jgi:hypothetical protein
MMFVSMSLVASIPCDDFSCFFRTSIHPFVAPRYFTCTKEGLSHFRESGGEPRGVVTLGETPEWSAFEGRIM